MQLNAVQRNTMLVLLPFTVLRFVPLRSALLRSLRFLPSPPLLIVCPRCRLLLIEPGTPLFIQVRISSFRIIILFHSLSLSRFRTRLPRDLFVGRAFEILFEDKRENEQTSRLIISRERRKKRGRTFDTTICLQESFRKESIPTKTAPKDTKKILGG